MYIYRAGNNESIYDIAREYGVSPIKIAENNELEIRGRLPRGREVLILTPSRTYNARSTDTLGKIADRFKTTKESLMRLNPELCGREKIYSGQLLTIRESTPSYGMISTNGYLYAGAPRDRLTAILPYLSYVTVCSAVYKDGRISNLYQSEDTVNHIKSLGRVPMLRIYMTELPRKDGDVDFANSVSIIAASGGFSGVTLSSINTMCSDNERLSSLILTVRKILMENDMLLFAEGDLDSDTSYMDYADSGILTYDKLHRTDAPSFNDGERAALEKFAYSGESSRSFLELSSFAFSGGKFIEKREGARLADKRHAEISHNEDTKLQRACFGKHKRREIISESLENTKAKLELVSELGFMGISFDIGRICIPDLMIAASMFDIISYPVMSPRISAQDM